MIKRTRKTPKNTPEPGSIGERVMALVEIDPRSPTEIAVAARLGKSYIRDLIRWPHRSPVMDKMDRLAAELGTTGQWLAYGAGEPPVMISQHLNKIAGESMPEASDPSIDYGESAPIPLSGVLHGDERRRYLTPPIAQTLTPSAFPSEVAASPWSGFNIAALKKDLPVRGTAAGRDISSFVLTDKTTEIARRPSALEGIADAYALRVIGRTMAPLHKPRDLCVIHPYLPYAPEDSVVIQTQSSEGGGIVAYLKTFVREDEDGITVTQINPPDTFHFTREQVVSIHKVLTVNDILSA